MGLSIKMKRIWDTWQGSSFKDATLLFGLALGTRVIVSLAQALYGVNGLPGFGLSPWNDFHSVYALWLGYVQNGLIPYRDFYTYKYTPMFLYGLYPFFAAAGAQAASIPIVVSDAATAVLVFLIAERFAEKRVAFAAGLLYAFSPFVLYYEGYLWLSSQPLTFFMILAVYLLKDNKPMLSFAALAVAVMFKQEALFILPAYLLLYAREYRGSILKGTGLFVAILVVISLPFLIIAPRDYLSSIDYLPFNLGFPEPSAPLASVIIGVISPERNPFGTCQITTIPELYSGTVCGTIINTKEFAASLLVGRVNQIAFILEPLLLALLAPAIYVSRKSQNFVQMLSIYSILVSLVLFSYLAEASLAYYFVPVYALIFASVGNKRTLLLGAATAFLSAMIPEGPFQVILPLAYLFLLIVIQDTQASPPAVRKESIFMRARGGFAQTATSPTPDRRLRTVKSILSA